MEGLFRRGGTWWARLVVPARLRQAAGRREFVKTTGSHDVAVGKLVGSVLLAQWRRQLFELERDRVDDETILRLVDGSPSLAAPGYLTLERAAQLTGLSVDDLLREVEAGHLSLGCRVPRKTGVALDDGVVNEPSPGLGYVVDLWTLVPAHPRGGYDLPHQPPAGSYDVDLGGEVLRLHDGGGDVARAVLADGLEAVDLVLLERDWGTPRWGFVPDTALWVAVASLEARAADVEALRLRRAVLVSPERLERARGAHLAPRGGEGAATGKWAQKCFSEALAEYCTDKSGLPHDLRSEHDIRHRRGQMMVFTEFMGDLRLCEIDGDVLRAYRDGPLRTIPGSVNRLPKPIQRETMKATIEALREDGREWRMLSDAMRQERMAHLAGFFGWLEGRGYLTPNPAAGLRGETGMTKAERVDQERGEDDDEGGRDPFTDDQLRAIFSQRHFQLGDGRHVKKPAYWYPFEFWLPLLGLYGGVRIKEGAQLHLADVRQVEGVWFLDINKRTADKALKNKESVRLIPVHPELVRLGFLDYCDALRVAGSKRVFPELTWATSPAKYAKEPIRKMSKMLEGLGMPRDGTLVFHCLRHNCNNTLERVTSAMLPDISVEIIRHARLRIMGHSVGDSVNAKHYTTVKSHELAALMVTLKFDLPAIAPFDIEFGLACVRGALLKKAGDRRGREDMGPLG